MVLDHFLAPIEPKPFLDWALTNFEQFPEEFYTILLEENPKLLQK
jgi:hypothetical protein